MYSQKRQSETARSMWSVADTEPADDSGLRAKDRAAHDIEKEEPLYRIQSMAREEAAGRAFVNLFRRLFGLQVKKTSQDAEFKVLDRYRVPRKYATWTGEDR